MSPAHEYKQFEKKVFGRVGAFFKKMFGAVGSWFSSFFKLGSQKYTVMFVPHSEKRVFNFQINLFSLLMIIVLSSVLLAGFFFISASFADLKVDYAKVEEAELDKGNKLDTVREELQDFKRVANKFEAALNDALASLGVELPSVEVRRAGQGDLLHFSNLESTDAETVPEVAIIKRFTDYMNGAVHSIEDLEDLLDAQKDFLADIPTRWPLRGVRGRLTQPFGANLNPFTKVWYIHKGIDLAVGYGIPIVSAANGKVVSVDYDANGYGNYITIKHKYGFFTRYAHMQHVYVKKGQEVRQGEQVGTMGNSGNSTGPHLHFEISIGADHVDPFMYLNIANAVGGR